MRFEEILDAATQLLQRRRRISSRALQREYGLDDAALSDLVHELVDVLGIARVDAQGVLEARAAPAAPAAPAEPERRLITVVFCDIAASTRLAGQMDPEDWRDLLRTFQHECAGVLLPQGGHIAQYLGDGLLAYFGWPAAHEDDAERAVRAALALQPALKRATSARLEHLQPGGLQVRVGIHTGVVVVDAMGAGERRESLASGEAPNLAAHIQARAAPGTLVVSATTLRLLHDHFVTEDLGLHRLKNAAQPVRLAWVKGERDPAERQSALRAPLIDLDGKLALLHQAWSAARSGAGRVVTLRGEPGLGKTRLAGELRTAVQASGADAMVLRCSAFHRHSALYPLADHLARRIGLAPHSTDDELGVRLTAWLNDAGIRRADALPLLAALLAPASSLAEATAGLAPSELMEGTQALLIDWLTTASVRAPMVVVCEDLHWADPSTLRLLQRLVAVAPSCRGLLVLLTQRPDFDPPWPVDAGLIDLERLPEDAMRLLVRGLVQEARPDQPGSELPEPLLQHVIQMADGVPLYAEEILRTVMETPATVGPAGASALPTSLSALLLARLDRLGQTKSVAQTAALLGREFPMELLAAVTGMPMPELGQSLHQLTRAGLLRRLGVVPQARYVFRHALLQSAAEDSLLRSTRKTLHQRIGSVLQAQFPAVLEREPETVARHFTEGGESERALPLWQQAGERALARSAVVEALVALDQGMSLLPDLPSEDAALRAELALQLLRLSALRASQGVAAEATGAASQRAVDLARSLGDQAALITALNGLYAYHMVRGQCSAALAPARELQQVAQTSADATAEMIGHRALGAVAFHVGQPATATDHLERALAMYDHERHASLAHRQGIDHKVMAGNFLALTRLVLGQDADAQALQQATIAHAEATNHAHSLAQSLVFGCLLLSLLEQAPALAERAARTVQVGRDHRFALMAGAGRFFEGAALLHQGHPAEALPIMQAGAQAWWGTGARNYRAHGELLMAQAEAALGRLDAARSQLDAAHEGIALTGETWLQPEVLRVEALLLRPIEGDERCRDRLLAALALAQAQGAHGWARRCGASLGAMDARA